MLERIYGVNFSVLKTKYGLEKFLPLRYFFYIPNLNFATVDFLIFMCFKKQNKDEFDIY